MARALHKPIPWLPIDSRLISFSHVHGIAKVFLIIEIVTSVGVVAGTILLAILKQQIFIAPSP